MSSRHRQAAHQRDLARLRRLIAGLERPAPALDKPATGSVLTLGIEAIDGGFAGGGLALHRLHEVMAASYGDGPAARGFCAALVARLLAARPGASVLWCLRLRDGLDFGLPYGPGLKAFGLDPARLIFARLRHDRDILWAMEEGLCAHALAAVVGEVEDADLTHTRRLSLACARIATPAILLRRPGARVASAAHSRWRIAAGLSAPDPFDPEAPGWPRWRLELTKNRSGRTGVWMVDWDHETHRFHLAAPVADRAAAATPAPVAEWIAPLRRSA